MLFCEPSALGIQSFDQSCPSSHGFFQGVVSASENKLPLVSGVGHVHSFAPVKADSRVPAGVVLFLPDVSTVELLGDISEVLDPIVEWVLIDVVNVVLGPGAVDIHPDDAGCVDNAARQIDLSSVSGKGACFIPRFIPACLGIPPEQLPGLRLIRKHVEDFIMSWQQQFLVAPCSAARALCRQYEFQPTHFLLRAT